MTSKVIATGILRALTVVGGVVLICYFLFEIQTVLLYLVLSLILTLIANPVLDFLKNRLRFKHSIATVTTLSLFIFMIVGFIMLFVPLVIDQGQNLSLLNTSNIEKNSIQLYEQAITYLEKHNIDTSRLMKEQNVFSKINFNIIPNFLNNLLAMVSSFGIGLASVLFITFFFLNDRNLFVEGAKKLIPDSHETQILNSVYKINHLLSRYFIGLLLQLFIVFVLYLIVLLIFGVDNAIVIAFLCGLLNIVPYVGPLIASVLAALLTMISHLGSDFQTEILPTTIYVLIGFWVVQIIDNNLSQPIIFSKSVSSHPLEIFLVILIAGFLTGILGMIVAVPFYTILKVIGKEFFPNNIVIKLLTKNI